MAVLGRLCAHRFEVVAEGLDLGARPHREGEPETRGERHEREVLGRVAAQLRVDERCEDRYSARHQHQGYRRRALRA